MAAPGGLSIREGHHTERTRPLPHSQKLKGHSVLLGSVQETSQKVVPAQALG